MNSKERSWALTKEGPIHEVKKDHEGPKSQKKEKERNNNNKKEKKRGLRLGQVREHATRISVRLDDMQQNEHQGPRILMCPFEALRRGSWLTYWKAKVYIQISSKKVI